MLTFVYLDKSKKNEYLPCLFDILYSNMKEISPIGFNKAEFISEVGSALEKDPRKILLLYEGKTLAGFLMYYTRENMIMIEELQLVKKYQRTRALYHLCKYMIEALPESIEYIESFVHKDNANSISLQNWFGMTEIEKVNENLLHLRGNTKLLKSKIR